MIAPEAGEMIQELILAKIKGLGTRDLFNKIYPYPTASRVNKSIVIQKYSNQITPLMKRVLRFFY